VNSEEFIVAKNILRLFMDKLLEFPLWVKQIIYLRLYQNLESLLSEDFISTNEEHMFQLYSPTLSFMGRTELTERVGGFDNNIYNFLANVANNLNMLEISMNNFWTMEEVAKYFIFCLDQNYVKTPDSAPVFAMAGFMSGKFRTGEFFKRIGKINVDQLEKAILTQKESKEKGEQRMIAEIMISLGYVTEKDTSSLLVMKEESKKRFILDTSIIPKNETPVVKDENHYESEIAKLTEQNNMLKDRLTKILTLVKKNG